MAKEHSAGAALPATEAELPAETRVSQKVLEKEKKEKSLRGLTWRAR